MIGSVYKIISGLGDECYIGSTLNKLRFRFQEHKQRYKQHKDTGYGHVSVFQLFDKYGIENCKIMLIKQYDVCDHAHLRVYETLWLIRSKTAINKMMPFNIKWLYNRHYRQENSEKIKQYYQENSEKIKEKKKQYRQENSEKIKEKKKQYYQENSEKIRERTKQYRQENSEKIKERNSEKVMCECGCALRRYDIKRHRRTKKHEDLLSKNVSSHFMQVGI
jgi:hypothetical protein